MKHSAIAIIAILLIAGLTAVVVVPLNLANRNTEPPIYLGVSFCGNTTAEAKLLIDRVKSYTNLFVLQSFPVSRNETQVYEIADYAVSQGLYLIVNLGTWDNETWSWRLKIFENGDSRWGDHYLGAYYDDEPGGMQIDYNWTDFFNQWGTYLGYNRSALQTPLGKIYAKWMDAQVNGTRPQDYDLEAELFEDYFKQYHGFRDMKETGVKLFVSEYALHWWDYLVGYDVVLAQFGSNSSNIRDIDFVRGAARMQNKEWGAIITWKYREPPYLDTGEVIHEQMMQAVEAGAKYIVIFDYPQIEGNPYGVLQEEHFTALEGFANDVMATAKMRTLSDERQADAVLVLPRNYGWGMRNPEDIIWGFWPPDDKSPQVWDTFTKLILQYGIRLDIVYDDPAFPVTGRYEHIYYWNQTIT
ncbi:MAG: hypothetical protein ACE14S_04480 [Candidatus Bathyarchaeia archaeon]